MSILMKRLLGRLHAPAGDDGSDAGGTGTGTGAEAGGDGGTAVLDDDDAYMNLSDEERSRLRGDATGEVLNPETLAALVASGKPGSASPEPAAADPEDGATGNDKGGGIPRARFNEVNDRRKALEQENEQLRAQLSGRGGTAAHAPAPSFAPPAFSFQEAEVQYAQLMLDGDTKGAAALRMQINAAIEESAYARLRQDTAQQQEHARAEQAVDGLLQAYPWLDGPEGKEALELIESVVMVKTSRGMPQSQALAEAVNTIAPRFAPGNHPDRAVQGGGVSGDMRVQRANQRGALDSQLQPATLQAGIGNRATPAQIDASNLTDDEYMALPEAERKKLRGD